MKNTQEVQKGLYGRQRPFIQLRNLLLNLKKSKNSKADNDLSKIEQKKEIKENKSLATATFVKSLILDSNRSGVNDKKNMFKNLNFSNDHMAVIQGVNMRSTKYLINGANNITRKHAKHRSLLDNI